MHLCLIRLLRWQSSNVERLSQVLDPLVNAIHRVVFRNFEVRAALQPGFISIWRALRGFEPQVRV